MSRLPLLLDALLRGPRTAIFAVRALVLALVLGGVGAAPAWAQTGPVRDSVVVTNRASLVFRADDGTEGTAEAQAVVLAERTVAVSLAPPREAVVFPGGRATFAHRLENRGTGADRFLLEAAAPAGWSVSLFLDLDGDGAPGAGDLRITSAVALESGAGAALLVVVEAPRDAADGAGVQVVVRATSQANARAQAEVADRVSVRLPLAALALLKAVDRAEATRGDTLAYTLSWTNAGDGAAEDVVLTDTLPLGARFVPGSLRLGGAALSDAADGDAGEVIRDAAGRETVRLRAGTLLPGAAGAAQLRVSVAADAPTGTMENVARLASGTAAVASEPARTVVGLPRLEVTKERLGADTVQAGAEVRFRLGWANRSATLSAYEVVLADTLPAELVFVAADRPAEVEGQVLRWRLGTLAPGAEGSLVVTTRAAFTPGQPGAVVNRVVARGTNAAAVTAAAAPLAVQAFEGDELEIAKTAGVLEAGAGEAVPYAVTLRNVGPVPLSGIVVHDRIPAGARFVERGLEGADSARARGREVTFWVAGPLAPGSTHTLRYTLVLVAQGSGGAVRNQAWATAQEGRVRSDTASALVRMRRGFAMQSRTVMGKVWIDRDGDGRQGEGDEGVAGADVWSADGQVVTTDKEGRFSFREMTNGTHVLRVDPMGLPTGFGPERPDEAMSTVRLDGWTTPHVSFRLVPRAADSAAAPARASAPVLASAAVGVSATVAPRAAAPSGTSAAAPVTSPFRVAKGDALPVDSARRAAPPAATGADSARAPAVAPLRTAEERDEDERRAFVAGPAVRIFSPADGAVVSSNRLYVGVRGEPGAAVTLYDGERVVAEGVLRPDGVQDFVGVELGPGAHRLRVAMRGTWKAERWDSAAVHRSDEPARLELPSGAATLRADGRSGDTLRVRLLDRWGVPVTGGVMVTVAARGAEALGADADPSSVGLQLRSASDGWVSIPLRAGRAVGPGEVSVEVGRVRGRIPLRVLAATRPLIATGAAQVGIGAAPEAFGAVTVRGALDEQTSLSVSIDSRRSDAESDFFGRGYDPLEEGRYPTLGDASERRVLSGATQTVSARVERGFDWLELGDVRTGGFGAEGGLGAYQRALTGVSGRVTTGAVVWQGFGSLTDQSLDQRQLRGDGSSGPYLFGGGVRPGTERVWIEVRDLQNAGRVLAREELAPFVDYQIDYASGSVLLQRPVPAFDPAGNPVFVVASLERRSGGEQRFVGGLRMEVDAAKALRRSGLDSLGVAVFGVRDDAARAPGAAAVKDLVGGDVRLRHRGLELGAEVVRAATPDSAALAGRADLRLSLPGDRVRLSGEWMSVGDGFAATANPRLSGGGTRELSVGAEVKVTQDASVRLRHERQSFDRYDVQRATTTLQAEQTVAGRRLTTQGGISSDAAAAGSSTSATARATLAVSPKMDLWVEGWHALDGDTAAAATRPDQLSLGTSYEVMKGTRLEAARRWVRMHEDSGTYALTSFGLRTERVLGGQVWGSLERTDAASASHSAVLGWNQRLALSGGWQVTSLFEKRFGLERAPLVDPARALPFAQAERDRWSAALGVEWLPADGRPRLGARGEVHDGEDRSGWRFDLSGDAPLGRSLALLTRHDWSRDEYTSLGLAGGETSRRERSMLGFAYRPVSSDAWNALAKVEWRRTMNPLGGAAVLSSARDERRLIGAGDVVWTPRRETELSARYAVRWTEAQDSLLGSTALRSFAHYGGLRLDQAVGTLDRAERFPLRARLDGRMLLEGISEQARWSLAPSLAVGIGAQLELEGGYRFGDLRDPDFATSGGRGLFATLGVRFTESVFENVAEFWRARQ